MRFLTAPPGPGLAGGVLAHGAGPLPKGHALTVADLASLAAAGVASVAVALPDPGDVDEDRAAALLGAALAGPGLAADPATTGRCNLRATMDGLLALDPAAIAALNALDEALTLATLPPLARVRPGTLVATVKILPFFVPAALLRAGEAAARTAVLGLTPIAPPRGWLVQTTLPGLKESVLEKAVRTTGARLAALGGVLAGEARVPHAVAPLAASLRAVPASATLALVMGAAATSDRRDVVPAALEAAGGRVVRFGMPVDPGNLIVLGRLADGRPALGLPGCARSPAMNGLDWVLERLAAGLAVDGPALAAMGVGGLLHEPPGRPRPREAPPAHMAARVAGLLLAAGAGRRMGGAKMLRPFAGAPLVTHAARAARAAGIAPLIACVAAGPEGASVGAALTGLVDRVTPVPDSETGLSATLRAGLAALPPDCDAALILLGDMPRVRPETLRALVTAWEAARDGAAPCASLVPTYRERRGNPVVLGRRLWGEVARLTGDIGARPVLAAHPDLVRELPVDDPGVLLDLDTPSDLAAAEG